MTTAMAMSQERSYAPPEAEWKYTIGYVGMFNQSSSCEWETCSTRSKMFVEKDTMIEGRDVAVLRISYGGEDGDERLRSGRLLVTNEGQKVYNYLLDSFYLLYDFGAVEGDTLSVGLPVNLDGFTGNSLESSTILTGRVVVMDFPTYQTYESINFDFRMDGIYPGIGQFPSLFSIPTIASEFVCGGKQVCYTDSLGMVPFNGNCGCEWPREGANSVLEQLAKAVEISPNPSSSTLTIESDVQWKSIKISTAEGRVVIHRVYHNLVETEELTAGVYFLSLTDRQGLSITKRFVKI